VDISQSCSHGNNQKNAAYNPEFDPFSLHVNFSINLPEVLNPSGKTQKLQPSTELPGS